MTSQPTTRTAPLRRRDTLQARLIASHAFVILIALAMLLVISVIFLRRYELTAERERLEQLAVPLVAQTNAARLLDDDSVTPAARRIGTEALDAQASAMHVRILVLNGRGVVRYDSATDATLEGTEITDLSPIAIATLDRARAGSEFVTAFERPHGDQPFAGSNVMIAAGMTGPLEPKRTLIIVSNQRRFPLVRRAFPRLVLIAGASLALASLVGLLLSRRIAQPIHKLTSAADGIAAGRLDQTVPGEGPDEIGGLVRSFNTMSATVSATHRSQRDLLANVAHELRTPLTSVQGYARALRDDVIDEPGERARALDVISGEAERMSALIAQLLDLARIESGQARLTLIDLDAAAVVETVIERFRPSSIAKDITLTVDAEPSLRVRADDARLTQILSNLVANAIRHTSSGGSVSVSIAPSESGRVSFTVADTGPGIPPARHATIFQRFERGDPPPGEPAGAGLGLAIVRELVDLHGGTVAVQSEPGDGAIFTVALPAT